MRESLTVIAGLVLLVLLAALALPAMIDWNQHRALIEARLRAVAGVEVVTTGPIGLRFLPSPRIDIAGVRFGDADPTGTRLIARRLVAEVELTGFLRGELHVNELTIDGAELDIATRGRTLVPPAILAGVEGPSGVSRLTVSRGAVRLLDETGAPWFSSSVALEATGPQAGGPWRIEGELGGRSIRVATGDRDGQGRLRVRTNLIEGPMRAEFDGWIGARRLGDAFQPELAGAVQMLWPGPVEAPPLLSVAGQAEFGPSAERVTGLVIESAGVGRLEGEAALGGPRPALTLRGRRIDASAWIERFPGGPPMQVSALLSRFAEIGLDIEQLVYRGEEASEVAARIMRDGAATDGVWRLASGAARFAGASASARAEGSGLRLELDSPDMRRIALALQRLGLPDETASDLGSLGDVKGEALIRRDAAGWRAERWRLSGRFGEASGTAAQTQDASSITGQVTGADLLALMRPAAAVMSFAPGPLTAAFSARRATLGQSPPGQAEVSLSRRDGLWTLRSATASGFDGINLAARRDGDAAPLTISISAQRADAVAAAAERLTDAPGAVRLLRSLRGVSPLRVAGVVTPDAAGWGAVLDGEAGPLRLNGAARMSASGAMTDGELTLAAADRGLLFRALGLPSPANAGLPARAVIRARPEGAAITLAGDDGLRLEALAPASGRPFPVTIAGPVAGLAPGWLGAPPATMLTGTATARLLDGVLTLEAISATLGPDRLTGTLTIHGPGRVEGRLAMPRLTATALAWPALGPATLFDAAGAWSAERIGEAPNPPDLTLMLESPAVAVPGVGDMAGSLRLRLDAGGLRLSDIALARGEAALSGQVEADRAGAQLSVRARIEARGVDLAALGPDFAGQADLRLQLGAFGETPARLAASLNGGGEVTLRGASVLRFDPVALDRIAASAGADIIVTEAPALAQSVRRAVENAGWPLADRTANVLVAGGVARLGLFIDDKPNATGAFNGLLDIRSWQGELRAAAALKTAPRGWTGAPPQIALGWRGPWRQMQRGYDVSALSNALSQKALQREIERVEAFEADIRERAMFNRRLRAAREADEARRRAEEEAEAEARRLREQQLQEQAGQMEPPSSVLPPLPPPIIINPVPAPLSRQPARAN